eukprot:2070151-Pleurochrysis_carterae.AAC.10
MAVELGACGYICGLAETRTVWPGVSADEGWFLLPLRSSFWNRNRGKVEVALSGRAHSAFRSATRSSPRRRPSPDGFRRGPALRAPPSRQGLRYPTQAWSGLFLSEPVRLSARVRVSVRENEHLCTRMPVWMRTNAGLRASTPALLHACAGARLRAFAGACTYTWTPAPAPASGPLRLRSWARRRPADVCACAGASRAPVSAWDRDQLGVGRQRAAQHLTSKRQKRRAWRPRAAP